MSDAMLMWLEISFDMLYLITVWILVVYMWKKKNNLSETNKKTGMLFILSFLLLAVGDTGHVGFRVVAYALGGLESNPVLVGLGSLATAYTVTVFYMLIAEIWRVRFNKERNTIWWILIIVGIIRLFIMIPSGNGWFETSSPFDWSMARNIPLMIQGLGIAVLLLVDGIKNKDNFSKLISYMIFTSYAFYMPVIFFVQEIPMLGMLMMPKTLAYVAVAVIALSLFKQKK
ncbi:hypothetical protein OAO42_00340 [Candidatus Izimaplasma bacterium]|nr:hypothetical protein [Candidatus Izimaplasma bacterium]